ncbi:MAG: hypothetical protein H6581_17310 [Bacteroidia bacterium]|nr:hypothetical protein [Bacteroidia bacterium]
MSNFRKFKLICAVFLPLSAMLLSLPACGPKDDDPTDITPDSTTSLTFRLYEQSVDTGPFAVGALVGLAATDVQRDNGIFLFSRTSDQVGVAKFTAIDTITYYYNIQWVSPMNVQKVKKGTVKLSVAEKKTLFFAL